jgi:Fur family ferric uptake transcriptional regulator
VTVAAHGPRLEPRTLDEAVAALRERGIRVTAARRLVLQGLFAADVPVSAERLASGVDGAVPPSDLASVYRNLEALERVGLVRHVHLGHGPGLYTRSGQEEREYLVCERCGDLQAVEAGQLDAVRDTIREAFGFEARFSHFPIAGLCARCAR